MRSSEDTRDFALWCTRNVTMGRERVGMYTMHATHSLNDLCVHNNLENPRGAELRTMQKGAATIARRCNSGYNIQKGVHVSICGCTVCIVCNCCLVRAAEVNMF